MSESTPAWLRRLAIPLLFLLLAALVVLLNASSGLPHLLPRELRDPVRATVILVVGMLVSAFLERVVFRHPPLTATPRRITTIRFMVRLGLYLAVGLGVLGAFGAGLSSVLFGGAFITVILGLAGQTMFQNLLGGIWLVFFHPFEVGDTIEMVAWQYPLLMPSFPHEAMRPAYVGTVRDLSLMYTTLDLESGLQLQVPNGILVQAALANRTRSRVRALRVRFEIPASLPLDTFLAQLQERLRALPAIASGHHLEVLLADLTKDSVHVVVTVGHRESQDDRIRHQVLQTAWAVQVACSPASSPS
jgi:small conductance mechanosensitive channel